MRQAPFKLTHPRPPKLKESDVKQACLDLLALKQYFAGRGITVILVDDLTGEHGERDAHLHSISHGVITLERKTLEFGSARRQVQIQKMRGIAGRLRRAVKRCRGRPCRTFPGSWGGSPTRPAPRRDDVA